jgi:hypothetical protein
MTVGLVIAAITDLRSSDCALAALVSLLFIEATLSSTVRSLQGRLSAAILSSLMRQLEKPRCAESQLNCFYEGRLQEKLCGLLAKNLLSASSGKL